MFTVPGGLNVSAIAIYTLPSSQSHVMVTWPRPAQPNGPISYYMVHRSFQQHDGIVNKTHNMTTEELTDDVHCVKPGKVSFIIIAVNTDGINHWQSPPAQSDKLPICQVKCKCLGLNATLFPHYNVTFLPVTFFWSCAIFWNFYKMLNYLRALYIQKLKNN